MAAGVSCNASSSNFVMQCDTGGTHNTLEAMLVACSSSPMNFQGVVREQAQVAGKRFHGYGGGASSTGDASDDPDTGDDVEFVDEYACMYQPGLKKRRLTPEQVKMLEKSFAIENKLEPDRKVQLSKDLNLEPRQVAVWFQNRRARWKTKQLEKDYDALKLTYHSLKANFEVLLTEKQHLENEVACLTEKLLRNGETQFKIDRLENWKDGLPSKAVCRDEEGGHNIKSKHPPEAPVSEESAISEASSPHAIDSGKGIVSTTFVETAAEIDTFANACEGNVGARVLPLLNQPNLVKLEFDEESETSFNCFLLEADQGTLRWWSTSWP